jgi:hypothetical protein
MVMTDPNYTAEVIIMDRSGSMAQIKSDAQGALNQFVKDQKELPGKATLTLAQFDDKYELVFLNKPLSEVGNITLIPRGNTALLDAMGRTIVAVGESFAAMPENERPSKVLVAILTDGKENWSVEWDHERVFKLVTEQKEKWNWEFIYLSAHADAIQDAAKVGIDRHQTKSWIPTGAGVRAGGQSMTAYASSYRSTGVGTFDEDEDEKEE